MLIFIRSFREGNFQLYFESLWSLLKWYFAIDKYNYARWATIHWSDLAKLQDVCPSIYSEMTNGYFSFQKTNRKFSRMALDQIHEQNTTDIKGVSGATNLLNRVDNSELSRWELCGPDLVRLVTEFENNWDKNGIEEMPPHHEEKPQFQKTIFDDVQKNYIRNAVQSIWTAVNNTNVHFDDHVYQSISKIELTGKEQCLAFIKIIRKSR